mgnify:CR=1 FL=1
MTKFESKEVENYYYDTLEKLGIRHILWDSGRTVTKMMWTYLRVSLQERSILKFPECLLLILHN